ncbi:MAG TPA: phosphotransferase [Chloroflexota bacterium]|nr:phosphotransferase [Chloroflexota bacterium]
MVVNSPDPVLDFDLVLALARRHLQLARAVTAVDESGGEARTYRIDDGYILKTQRPHRVRPRTSLEKEVAHLQLVQQYLPELSVPRVLGYGRTEGVEYTLMTRMPGVAARHVPMEGEARGRFLYDLGALLRRLHRLPLAPFASTGRFPTDHDASDVRRRVETAVADGVNAARLVGDAWNLELPPEAVAARALEAVGQVEDTFAPLHSNPGPEHVFVDPTTLKLSGLIDFGDAYVSHPAFDLRRWTAPEDRGMLLEGYAADEPVSDAFKSLWRAILIAGLLSRLAQRPTEQARTLADLQSLLAEF